MLGAESKELRPKDGGIEEAQEDVTRDADELRLLIVGPLLDDVLHQVVQYKAKGRGALRDRFFSEGQRTTHPKSINGTKDALGGPLDVRLEDDPVGLGVVALFEARRIELDRVILIDDVVHDRLEHRVQIRHRDQFHIIIDALRGQRIGTEERIGIGARGDLDGYFHRENSK